MSGRPHLRWLCRLVLMAGLTIFVLLPTAAWAQSSGDYPPSTTVTTKHDPCVGSNGASVCGTAVTVPRGGSALPFTGGDVALLTVLGLGAAAGGVGLVLVSRRTRSAA